MADDEITIIDPNDFFFGFKKKGDSTDPKKIKKNTGLED